MFGDKTLDITDTTHPGMSTILASEEEPITINTSFDSEVQPGKLPMYNSPLIFSAPQSSAWVWAQSQSLNYSGIWNLTDYNSGIQTIFQSAIFNTPPGSSSSQLHKYVYNLLKMVN